MEMTYLHAIANVINFLLFLFIVVKFAGPAIETMVKERQEATKASIDGANAAQAMAAEGLELTKARLANVDAELAEIVSNARQVAASQAADLEALGHRDAERLRESAKGDIERERQAAVNDIRKALLDQAFERAAAELQRHMTADRQRELVSGLVQKVGDGSLAIK